ncbi:Importin subunit beta-2 [Neolecta irregularis DAH-3]|uniref:Importin subunit beta-2 n=1 Tax=Neolecta irregularis (strain DAH-3) TaxID=1198029 RepID=A0A1U7LIL8_NEOID|nr:Importin subunit beta-2 [Neolecta irregularis DAH-3]|eukprot:OLL22468.1 Importin subunit beta-2 [Neolecta irregularis DAH-3]
MSAWSPQPQPLSQLSQLLQTSLSENHQLSRVAIGHLEEAKIWPEFNNYLAYILTYAKDAEVTVRSNAGIYLKNNFRINGPTVGDNPSSLAYVKNAILVGLQDEQNLVRAISGSVVTTLMLKVGLLGWPECLPRLMVMLDSPTPSAGEGAFSALSKICEDSTKELDTEYNGQRPLNFMISKFITLCESPNPRMRAHALSCINQFIPRKSQSLMVNIDSFMAAIFKLATDSDTEVRKNVCHALVMLLDARPDKIAPSMNSIVEYMLYSTQDADEDVALEACEFWLSIAEQTELRPSLEPFLPKVVPMLLKGMIYNEMDILTLGGDEDDAHLEDDEKDIKPHHQLLEISLPYLRENLFSSDWKVREAGVLALGAIAEGCMEGITPHLPELYPYLLSLLKDPKPLVRQITCWTLGRYSRWAAYLQTEDEKNKFFLPLMEGLLRMCLDNNKRVQDAGCSAFANLEEQASTTLIPYLHPILTKLVEAFQKYQSKNLFILYDTIQTLADMVGPALNRPEYIEVLMPPLNQKWASMPDDDRGLFPLLECLSSITVALGEGFAPFALPVYSRCIQIIHRTLEQSHACQSNPSLDEPDKDFLTTALDLVSGLVQGLGEHIDHLISSTQPPLMDLLSLCLVDPVHDVKQSAFALVGDLAISHFKYVKPYLPQIMTNTIPHISPRPDSVSVCNNAIWAAGEIALQMQGDMEPYIGPLLQRLVTLLQADTKPPTLLENAAVTIGRLGLACPSAVAPQLESFVGAWFKTLQAVRDDEEKDSAFRGICTVIGQNPGGLSRNLHDFVMAVVTWDSPSTELNDMFKGILVGYKGMLDNWDNFMGTLSPEICQKLHVMYNV